MATQVNTNGQVSVTGSMAFDVHGRPVRVPDDAPTGPNGLRTVDLGRSEPMPISPDRPPGNDE